MPGGHRSGFGTFQRSYLYWLDNETLAQADVRQLKFNPTDDDFPRPFKVGGWEPTGSRNTGGIVLYDPRAGNFLAAGISPNGYNPDWFIQSPTRALFRFAPALLGDQPFVHIADVADDLPIPMSSPRRASAPMTRISCRSSATYDRDPHPRPDTARRR